MATEQRTFVWPDNTVWLASYPRSGNTYLRAILWTCFGLRSGSVYADDLLGDLVVSQHAGHFEGAAHGLFSADLRGWQGLSRCARSTPYRPGSSLRAASGRTG